MKQSPYNRQMDHATEKCLILIYFWYYSETQAQTSEQGHQSPYYAVWWNASWFCASVWSMNNGYLFPKIISYAK